MSATAILGYWTGLIWVAPELEGATLVRTALLVHVCDAVVCRILAANSGRPPGTWTVLGFVGGLWALIALLVLPRPLNPRP